MTVETADASGSMRAAVAQTGESLEQLSKKGAGVLAVFLRHAGCTFCREALADVAKFRAQIESRGVGIALVHMGDDESAAAFFGKYGLSDLPRISDPDRTLYRAMGLKRGNLWQLFGPGVWWRGIQAGVLGGHGIGRLRGDGFQMPGTFLIKDGVVVRAVRHKNAGERVDFCAVAENRPPR